jgi:hypothetical protein
MNLLIGLGWAIYTVCALSVCVREREREREKETLLLSPPHAP